MTQPQTHEALRARLRAMDFEVALECVERALEAGLSNEVVLKLLRELKGRATR